MPVRTLMVIVAPDGTIFDFNRECERVTGYSRQEAVGANLLELLVPEKWRREVAKRFEDAAKLNLELPHVNPWKTKDGSEKMIEWSCSFIHGERGREVVGFGRVSEV